jgi:thioesterase domain-containing protein
MTEPMQLCQELQTLWHTHFPIAHAMDVSVVSFADHTLTTQAPLQGNTNIHGSAFAGSLYSLEALTAWGLLYVELKLAGLDASIIHANANVDFATPVLGTLNAQSTLPGPDNLMQTLRATGKARVELKSELRSNGQLASTFSGLYALRLTA